MKLTSVLCPYDLLGIMRVGGDRMGDVEEHSKPREQHWQRPKDVGKYDVSVTFALNFGGRAPYGHLSYMPHFSFITEVFLENIWRRIYQHPFLECECFTQLLSE